MLLAIFDVDGTLVHSGRRDSRCFAGVYETLYGRPFTGIDWRQYPHVTDLTILDTALMQHFGRTSVEAEIRDFQALYLARLQAARDNDPAPFQEVPGASALIAHLLERPLEYRACIATGGWRRPAELKLRHIGVPAEALPVTGADGFRTRQEILQSAIDDARARWGNFHKTVYIGDAVWDVHTTREMGLDFLGVAYTADAGELESLGVRHILPDFLDQSLFFEKVHAAVPPVGT
ncbi:MAG: HAD family hydrolase [Saprospiraceae bacterium]|jgi:phosphoglycolate phosphatase-like HAD superfamily hydrolase